MNKYPILVGQHVCVKWDMAPRRNRMQEKVPLKMLQRSENHDSGPQKRTELAKRSIKFGLARFPLNRSVSQKENESLSGKRKAGRNRAYDALAGSTCRLSFSCSSSLVPYYVRRVRMLYGCCIIHLRSHTCSNCHMTN